MNETLADLAVEIVRQRIGIATNVRLNQSEPTSLELFPADVHPNESFALRFTPGWRSAEVEFVPGRFASPLIAQMGMAGPDSQSLLAAFAHALDRKKNRLTFRVNGVDVSVFDTNEWPTAWTKIELSARSAPQVINADDIAQMRGLIIELLVPVFGMVVALIGVEETDTNLEGEAEGAPIQSIVTRYERKKVNREACIQLNGLRCAACGFDFGAFYGQLGAGYVEVHHITPISELGPSYRINISTDLVPLCANCHAMVHRENPPVPISRLIELISGRRQT